MNRDSIMSSAALNDLLSKMRNSDMDFRYMALNDLLSQLQISNVQFEEQVASKLLEAVLKTLEDKNGEVQNMGVKCLGPLLRRCKEWHVQTVVDKLCRSGSTEELKDISSTALRTVILEISPNGNVAFGLTKRLVPKLLTQLQTSSETTDILLDTIDVLVELLNRFGLAVSALALEEQSALIAVLMKLLDNQRPAVRKRSVVALGSLVVYVPDELFSTFMSKLLEMLVISKSEEKLKSLISLLGQICKIEISLPGKDRFGRYLQTIAPIVLDSLQVENDELREIGLQSLESFVQQSDTQIKRYDQQIIRTILQFLRYDPNYNVDSDEDDEDMADLAADSDVDSGFGDDDAEYDDEDDISWKLRRCAAKLAAALFRAQPELLSEIAAQFVPVLVSRFTEREENVRIEVLLTFATLISLVSQTSPKQLSASRKRLRDNDLMDVESSVRPYETVCVSMSKIVKGLVNQLNSKSLPAKQASFTVLCELVKMQRTNVGKFLPVLLPVIGTSLNNSTSSTSTTNSVLQGFGLEFIKALCTNSDAAVLAPHLDALVQLTLQALQDNKLNKMSVVAIDAARSLLEIASSIEDTANYLKLCSALNDKITASNLDQEVRDHLFRAIGESVRLAPTRLDWKAVERACETLADRIKNETTRFEAISAISHAAVTSIKLERSWSVDTTLELLKYTASADKLLRTVAITGSSALLKHSGQALDAVSIDAISSKIVSLLECNDTQAMPAILNWLASLAQSLETSEQKAVVQDATLVCVCRVLRRNTTASGTLLIGPFSTYFRALASGLSADPIIQAITTDLTDANLPVLAKCIVIVLRNSGETHLPSTYIQEISAPKTAEEKRALALYVLGKYGQVAEVAPDTPELILSQFDSPSDRVKAAAAFALGNIISRDTDASLPFFFDHLDSKKFDASLMAVAMREIIANSSDQSPSHQLSPHIDTIWRKLLDLASDERAGNILAECIGRLTLIKPHQLLPELRKEIQSDTRSTRAVIIRAIRYTFTATDSGFDDLLRPFIVDFLSLMEDKTLDVRRLALSTLYSAAHNKPHLIQDHLSQLLPLLYQETIVREDLIHTVQMGPFKHIVDDGLDLRKSAFETLYTLLDSFLAGIEISKVFEIILRGFGDVHEIKTLCFLMCTLLAKNAPAETTTNLDAIAEKLTVLMNTKLKESAVKQEKERDHELKRSTLRCAVSLMPLSKEQTPGFNAFVNDLKTNRAAELQELVP